MSDTSPIDARSDKKRSRLGRGLSSLMSAPVEVQTSPEPNPPASTEPPADVSRETSDTTHSSTPTMSTPELPADANGLRMLPVDSLSPNPFQPRQDFDAEALEGLAASIKQSGVMQPVLVRPSGELDGFTLIAGERRWRAAQLAGLTTIPAVVRELDDNDTAEWALVENLQREDLNPIERAEAFQSLSSRLGLSHEQVAERVGVTRSVVTNLLRLLKLPANVQQAVRDDLISMGHARVLAGLDDHEKQAAITARIVREGLSVRQVEQLAKQPAASSNTASPTSPGEPAAGSAYLADLERQMSEQLGTKVQLKAGRKKGTGKMTIEFYDLDQFDALCEKLGVKPD